MRDRDEVDCLGCGWFNLNWLLPLVPGFGLLPAVLFEVGRGLQVPRQRHYNIIAGTPFSLPKILHPVGSSRTSQSQVVRIKF